MVGNLNDFIYSGTISLSFNVSQLPPGVTLRGKLKLGSQDVCEFENTPIQNGILVMTVMSSTPIAVGEYLFIVTLLDNQLKPIEQQKANLRVIELE